MAVFKPFSCIRPVADQVQLVATRPYDVMNEKEAREEAGANPRSFLNLSRPEVHFPEGTKPTNQEIHEKAKEQLGKWLKEGVFVEDQDESYYVYELSVDGRSQTGLVGCASVDDYLNHVVRQHEKVRQDKLEDRTTHISTVGAQTGCVFLAYRSRAAINSLIEQIKMTAPVYDFHGVDGVDHKVWKVCDMKVTASMEKAFADLDTMYIADGHHRAFAATRVCQLHREANPHCTGHEAFNYFMAVSFPDEQLAILPYNRVVADLCGASAEEFLAKIGEKFEIAERGSEQVMPAVKGTFGMYLDNCWYELTAKQEILSDDPVSGLDVAILQDHLLHPILGIGDPRTDKRIDFVGGIRGLGELEKRCREDMRVAFSMYPTSIGELFAVADADMLMPPKSTWFEPKLASGLFLHRL